MLELNTSQQSVTSAQKQFLNRNAIQNLIDGSILNEREIFKTKQQQTTDGIHAEIAKAATQINIASDDLKHWQEKTEIIEENYDRFKTLWYNMVEKVSTTEQLLKFEHQCEHMLDKSDHILASPEVGQLG